MGACWSAIQKTPRSWRTLEVPEYARPLLLRALDGAPTSGLLHASWGNVRRDLAAAMRRARPCQQSHPTTCAGPWPTGCDSAGGGSVAGRAVTWGTRPDAWSNASGRLTTSELSDAIGNRVDARTVRHLYAHPVQSVEILDAVERLKAALSLQNRWPETELNRRHGDFQSPTGAFPSQNACKSRPPPPRCARLYALRAAANDVVRAAG